MSKAVSTFISQLVLHFGEPKFDVSDLDKPKAHAEWLKSMIKTLRGYPDASLAKGAEIIVATRKYRSFPLVSECIDACQEAQKWHEAQKPKLAFSSASGALSQFSPERERLADDLVGGEMGRKAASDGWISALHQFCRKEMRLPQGHEIKTCIDEARSVDEWTNKAAHGGCGAFSHSVMQLGQSLQKRRDALRDRVLHGVIS